MRTIIVLLALLTIAAPAARAEDTEVFKSGQCTLRSHWTLELDREGSIEVDFEGHTPRAGQTWRAVMRHNGSVVWRGTRATEHDGDFEIDRTVRNASGTDTIAVRAVNKKNGEVCKGSGSI
ncbi:MAG TPA: hypothetical protein VF984_04800 [Actinomycetota bacterium]